MTVTISNFFKQDADRLTDDDMFKLLVELKKGGLAKKSKCIPGSLKLEISPVRPLLSIVVAGIVAAAALSERRCATGQGDSGISLQRSLRSKCDVQVGIYVGAIMGAHYLGVPRKKFL